MGEEIQNPIQLTIQLISNTLEEFERQHNLGPAEIQHLNNHNQDDIRFSIRWRLPNQDRPNRPARIIILIIPQERIDDYGLVESLELGRNNFMNFLGDFDPNHDNDPNNPPEVEYIIVW